MSDALYPESVDDVVAAITDAAKTQTTLEIVGGGSQRAFGRPVAEARMLSLARLTGIKTYEPEEMILIAASGTPVAEVEAVLAERGQRLAFEPALRPALFGESQGATLGGLAGSGLAGPRRVKAGGVRDHLLGFQAVNGLGQSFRAGGRVMKNVTGYDLPKLLCGSFGTLAVMTELTFKVAPIARAEKTIVVRGLAETVALPLLREIARLPLEVSGFAHVTPVAASHIGDVPGAGALTALRIEGSASAVDEAVEALTARLRKLNPATLGREFSQKLWGEIATLDPFARLEGQVWRLAIPPSAAESVSAEIGPRAVIYDWAGGLMWVLIDAAPTADAGLMRAAIAHHGGHATLMRADESVRAAVAVFEPEPAPLAALSAKVKDAFDPQRILNPGRMVRGV